MKKRTQQLLRGLKKRLYQSPLLVIVVLLVGLFGLIFLSAQLQQEEVAEVAEQKAQTVRTFVIGEQPKLETVGTIEQTGSITIVAQTPGIVQYVPVKAGDAVKKRQQVVRLASNYYGGNVLALQSGLAQQQYQFAVGTQDLQRDTIRVQRDLAQKNRDNTEELRLITERSIDDTKELLKINEELLDSVDDTLASATTSAEIQAAKQSKAQLLSVVSQLRSSLRTTEYQANSSAPPAELAQLQLDLSTRQLDLQEKTLELNVAVARLQSQIAAVSAAQMYPAAPFAGVVQRVHVNKGEYVAPGTPLVTLYSTEKIARVIVSLSPDQAEQISPFSESTLILPDGSSYLSKPQYVTQVPNAAGFITAEFILPDHMATLLSRERQIRVQLPVQAPDQTLSQVFVPLDAVHQSEQQTEVFVVDGEISRSRRIEIGQVVGAYVLVTSGLSEGDEVILDRSAIDGARIEVVTS